MAQAPIWHIPYQRNELFTGRKDTLALIHRLLQADGAESIAHPVGISGLGGIGKTQLVLEYAYLHQKDYEAAFWIRADTETNLIDDMAALVDVLELPEQQEHDYIKRIDAVLGWMRLHSAWLLIYDNADSLTTVQPFLPQGTGHILLTTRAYALEGLAQRLDLDKMEPETGALFLLRRVQILDVSMPLARANSAYVKSATAIAQELDGLPLALDQAGAFMLEAPCSLTEYLALYRTHHEELLRTRGDRVQHHADPVATTWSMAFEKVREADKAAAELLRFCAYLAPDAIPEAIITGAATTFRSPWVQSALGEIADDPLAFDSSMMILLHYSLMTRERETGLLRIHRLVQTVMQDASAEHEKSIMLSAQVIPALRDTFPDPEDIHQWKECARYIPHVLECIQWIVEEKLFFDSIGELLFKAGNYLEKQGRYREAEPVYKLSQTVFQNCGEQIGVAAVLNMLGVIYQRQRQYQQAEASYQQAQEILEAQSENVYFILAAVLGNRAELYRDQGKWQEATDSYEHHLLQQREESDETALDNAVTLNNHALLLTNQSKYEEAEPLYQKALTTRQNVLGDDHPEVANSLNNIAGLYRLMGRHSDAEQAYQQALAIMEQHYGADHPSVAFTLNNLGELFRVQGKYEKAEEYLLKALKIREEPPESPYRSHSLNSLGIVYMLQGRYAESEAFLRQALERQEHDLGDDHTDIAATLNNLGNCALHLGKIVEAEGYLKRSLVMKEKLIGKGHPDVAWSLNNLASLCQMQKKYSEAERLYGQAIEIQEQLPDQQNLALAGTLTNLGELYRVQRKYNKAQQVFQKALSIYQMEGQAIHPDMAHVLNNLGLLAHEKKLGDVAEQFYQAAIAVNERFLGTYHADLIPTLYNLVSLYEEHGIRTKADALYQRALAICEEQLGDEHPSTISMRDSYAAFLSSTVSKKKQRDICSSVLRLPFFKDAADP